MTQLEVILEVLEYASTLSVLAPLVVAIMCRKTMDSYMRPLFWYFIAGVLAEILLRVFAKLFHNNLVIINSFSALELILLLLFYAAYFRRFFNPIFIYACIPVFLLPAVIDYFQLGTKVYNVDFLTAVCLLFTALSLFTFYYLLKHLIYDDLLNSAFFYFNSAILLYFAGITFLSAFGNYLISGHNQLPFSVRDLIHGIINILYNILFCIGLWKTRRT